MQVLRRISCFLMCAMSRGEASSLAGLWLVPLVDFSFFL